MTKKEKRIVSKRQAGYKTVSWTAPTFGFCIRWLYEARYISQQLKVYLIHDGIMLMNKRQTQVNRHRLSQNVKMMAKDKKMIMISSP